MKVLMLSMIFFSLILSIGCSNNEKLSIKTSVDSCYLLKLQRHSPSTFGIDIVSNTLNDTAQIDGWKVPPEKIGKLYRAGDYYADSISVCYKKYKSTSGELVISYYY